MAGNTTVNAEEIFPNVVCHLQTIRETISARAEIAICHGWLVKREEMLQRANWFSPEVFMTKTRQKKGLS